MRQLWISSPDYPIQKLTACSYGEKRILIAFQIYETNVTIQHEMSQQRLKSMTLLLLLADIYHYYLRGVMSES